MPSSVMQSSQSKVPKHKVVQLYREAIKSGVPIDVLDKKIDTFLQRSQTTLSIEEHADFQHQKKLKRQTPIFSRVFFHLAPFLSLVIGFLLVASAAVPILSYYVLDTKQVADNSLLSPIPGEQVLEQIPSVVSQVQADTGSEGDTEELTVTPTFIDAELDYTNLSNWFPDGSVPTVDVTQGKTPEYRVDIPSLKIENARVRIGGTNLDHSLIQYPGTAMPGEKGQPVIFGHSILRRFYNPSVSNPKRYNSIFSTIMTMKPGDKIYVTYDNIRYTYTVKDKKDVKPEDTYILSQNYDSKELKLVTCRPEGTYFLRGVVTAVLEETSTEAQ